MSITFDESKDQIAARVKLFRTNYRQYHAPGYKEVEVEESRDVEGHDIDALVYELYGLTEEEIKIVEGQA